MISNQVLQNTLEGLKEISRTEFCVLDTEGKVLASTFADFSIATQDVQAFVESQADSQLVKGFQYFKVCDDYQLEYILVAHGDDEDTYMVGKLAAFQIQNLIVAYKERFDKDSFIKNLLLDNLLLVDIYNRAKKLHIEADVRRVVMILEMPQEKDHSSMESVKSLFGGKSKDFITAVDEKSIIVKDDFVLEIGPGIGTMTQYLAETAREVAAVEIDKTLLPILDDTLKDWDNVTVINNDILKVDIRQLALEKNQGRPIKVVANLPYYITTPIIMGLFENQVPVDSITIMVQKEVADRMQVGPGTKDYGALSLAVQYYAKPKIVANVPPNCFMPRPKVGSAVIRLERYEKPPVEVKNEKLMFRIIRASFNQRRKTLVNGLKNSQEIPFSKEQIEQALGMCGLSLSVRGEALTLAQFAQLANAFTEIS